MIYDDLILRLRDAAKVSDALAVFLPHGGGDATSKLYNDAADAIEELGKSYWIPVAERLPQENQLVIGFTPVDGYMFVGYYSSYKWGSKIIAKWRIVTALRSTKEIKKKVTYWMPLPQPPENVLKEKNSG